MYRSEWAYIYNPYAKEEQNFVDWFRFDENGFMQTGWQIEPDGNLYYLWPEKDGTQGHMVTGWNWISDEEGNERCYYFHTESDGTRGRLWKNSVTPDGYQVNEHGAWEVNGVEQVRKTEEAASR